MSLSRIVDGAFLVPMGNANAVLLDAEGDLVLVDAGFPGKADQVLDAVGKLGHRPADLRHIVFTHVHPDHIGSAVPLIRATGARTYMHPIDAPLAESGGPFRPMTPAPGLVRSVMLRFLFDQHERTEPFRIDQRIEDGETLPLAGGLRVIHAPGHCAGQVALMWGGTRLLIAGDAFINILGVGDPIGFEDEAAGRRTQRALAALAPEAVCFGHGKPVVRGAAARLQRAATRR